MLLLAFNMAVPFVRIGVQNGPNRVASPRALGLK
jgi:hypothetical protein